MQIENVKLVDIWADDDFNCRGSIVEADIHELAKDIEAKGLLQPVVIFPIKHTTYKYQLVAGFRRYKAHQFLKKETIPCNVKEDIKNLVEAKIINIAENINRKDLTLDQEAQVVKYLMREGLSDKDIIQRLNVNYAWFQTRKFYTFLPIDVQNKILQGQINQSDIKNLYTIQSESGIDAMYEAVRQKIDAVLRGKRVDINPNKGKANAKCIRNKFDMNELMDHLAELNLFGFGTRILAWATGEISNEELDNDIKKLCEEEGKEYQPFEPKKNLLVKK